MKKIVLIFVIGVIFFSNINLSFCEQKEAEQTKFVSIITIIANPERFHNNKITTIGFVSLGFEGTAIYLSDNDFKNHIGKNALRLKLKNKEQFKQYDRKYVLIEGIFIKNKPKFFSLYSGDIEQITKMQEWES